MVANSEITLHGIIYSGCKAVAREYSGIPQHYPSHKAVARAETPTHNTTYPMD